MYSRFSITKTVTAIAIFILVLSLGAISWVISRAIAERMQEQAITSQNISLRAAATIIGQELPGAKIKWGKDGNVERVEIASIPVAFADHAMIDMIGRMTGQTATIFGWDSKSQDFWRRTTNIVKPDGKRAVGTALGKTGAVYPHVVKGETYRGKAVILDIPYYTIYQPIFSPSGDVIGILYAGVRSAEINAIATEMAYSIGQIVLMALLIGGALTAFFVRKIVGPLPRLTAVADRLAAGDLEITVPDQTLGNEIGALARSIDFFRQGAVQKIEVERLAAEAIAASERERHERASAEHESIRVVNEAVNQLAECLTKLSEGDLSVRIEGAFAGDLDKLRVDFNNSVEKLSATMASIYMETNSIEANSAEMRTASDDLSRRTEQQAASLEKTSAALEEVSVTVRGSSMKTDQAAGMALKAHESTATSSKVVGDAIAAMSRIEQASNEISKIINVIDEIAFQTNLLALNAGVEAARAGEAGKGFAVVAQEVRELAQRSANAAKDIKTLIGKSGEAVASGVTLVRQTGETLEEISGQVSLINEHISAVASAAREQSTALGNISGSINHMDQFTQKNAAMVEETAAVTHRLADNAGTLAGLIGQFRLQKAVPSPDEVSNVAPFPRSKVGGRWN